MAIGPVAGVGSLRCRGNGLTFKPACRQNPVQFEYPLSDVSWQFGPAQGRHPDIAAGTASVARQPRLRSLFAVQGVEWSGWPDLNRRPPAPKAGALTKLRHTPNRRENIA